MRIRKFSSGSSNPREVVRVMRPQIVRAMLAVKHHFRHRHVNGNGPVRKWVEHVKSLDAGSGYSTALRAIVTGE